MKLFLCILTAMLIGAVSGIAAVSDTIYRAGLVDGKRMATVSDQAAIQTYVIESCTPWFDDKRKGLLMACIAP